MISRRLALALSLLTSSCTIAAPAGAQSLPTNQRLYDTTTTMPELHASRVAKACSTPATRTTACT